MKLAKHVVLALGLAYTGGTFADATSPNTTPQPSQAIPALPVPTAAGGPNAPAAQAREDSKDAVESIKTIAEAAIKSAEDDVEIVKWIFSAILAAIAGLAAGTGRRRAPEPVTYTTWPAVMRSWGKTMRLLRT